MAQSLTSVEQDLLAKLADTLRTLPKQVTPLDDLHSMQVVSFHLLAQQLAFVNNKIPSAVGRQQFMKSCLDTLVDLIRKYEKELKNGKAIRK